MGLCSCTIASCVKLDVVCNLTNSCGEQKHLSPFTVLGNYFGSISISIHIYINKCKLLFDDWEDG